MQRYLYIGQIVISALLITSIIMQNRGSSLGGIFGGGDSNVYRTKRGAEKFLQTATIILVILFMGLGLANFIVY